METDNVINAGWEKFRDQSGLYGRGTKSWRGYWWTEGKKKKRGRGPVFPEDDTFTLRAIASVLHDIYVAVENIFELVGRSDFYSHLSLPASHLYFG